MGLVGPLACELARHYQVISYQLRGEDECFALRRSFGLLDLAEDLCELMDWFGLEQPTLLGVSFGGVVALDLALRRPGRLGQLILQGVGIRLEPGLLQRLAGTVLARYPLPCDSPFFNQFFNLFFGGRQQSGPLLDFVIRQCWQTDQAIMAHRFRIAEQTDFTERLGQLRVPALVMAGDRDLLVSKRGLKELASRLPALSVQLPGCGHLAFVTHAERVAAEIQAFLQR
jgi:pimeloyl-ACP methyl ester carboxylesterase